MEQRKEVEMEKKMQEVEEGSKSKRQTFMRSFGSPDLLEPMKAHTPTANP